MASLTSSRRIKIDKPGVGEFLILVQKDFVPGIHIIMITELNFPVGKTS
jgi:hypothetical protein